MASVSDATQLTMDELRQLVCAAEPTAILVEPRILRRVIKQDRRLAGLALFVPHRKSHVIQRERLLVIASHSELNVSIDDELPNRLILLAEPTDDEALDLVPREEMLYVYWRLLFHARIHMEMDRADDLDDQAIFDRVQAIGLAEFEEIRSVLAKDNMLFAVSDDRVVYEEFVAVYLELRYFAAADLPLYFPAIRDWEAIRALVARDLESDSLYRDTRLKDAPPSISRISESHNTSELEGSDAGENDPLQPSPPSYWKLQARAEKAGAMGNGVKAAILRTRATRLALPERVGESRLAASAEMSRLANRLQIVLGLSSHEVDQWIDALLPLLDPAARGYFTNEARCLYDLQKVCVEQERGVYSINLIEYLGSLGSQPLRRPLPLLREVLITKHLRTASRRLSTARISVAARERLAALLEAAVDRIEQQLRNRVRPIMAAVLDAVGLIPQNVPERVARRKLVEELLDGIVDNGFVNMGQLRDALSRNNLKLPDVTGAKELFRGDQLLRADRLLQQQLDGVYRAGAIYLRLPQTLSSLAFGTNYGRLVTQYLILPFGGAFLALEGLRHVAVGLYHALVPGRLPVAEPSDLTKSGSNSSGSNSKITDPQDNSTASLVTSNSPSGTAPQAASLEAQNGSSQGAKDESSPANSAVLDSSAPGSATGLSGTTRLSGSDSADTLLAVDSPVAGSSADNSTTETLESSDSADDPDASSPSDFFGILPPTDASGQIIVTPDLNSAPTKVGGGNTVEFFSAVFLLGLFLLALMHRPNFRAWCAEWMKLAWRGIKTIVFEIPAKIYRSETVQRVLHSQFYSIIRNYLLRPAALTLLIAGVSRLWQYTWEVDGTLNVFLLINLFINSPIGRYADEWVTDVVARTWHDLRMRIFAAAFQWILDVFHRLMENLERVLYVVDEWLRFRAGDSRISLAYKAAMSVIWFAVTYVIRIYVTLLIEPQVNPIKHFPVVTVSHKIMLPYTLVLTGIFAAPLKPFVGAFFANTFAATTVFLLPGLFGFLVWELKENWRLYAANRSRHLRPISIGYHGESLPRLLRPGFHSGTAPKLFTRLRHSLRKAQRTGDWNNVNACRANRMRLETQLRRFVERNFCYYLEESDPDELSSVTCGEVRVATNRIEIELRVGHDSQSSVHVQFEDHGNWLLASMPEIQVLQQWNERDRRRFETAFVGMLQQGAVDLLLERMRLEVSHPIAWFHLESRGILIFRTSSLGSSEFMPLLTDAGTPVKPAPEVLDVTRLSCSELPAVLTHTSILWSDWVSAWERFGTPETVRQSNVTTQSA